MASKRDRGGTDLSGSTIFLLVAVAMLSFFAGTIFTVHMNLDCVVHQGSINGLSEHHHINDKIEELTQTRILQKQILELEKVISTECNEKSSESKSTKSTSSSLLRFPDTTQKYAVGMARTSKMDFFDQLDVGVPLDVPKDGDSDVLFLYNRNEALPKEYIKKAMLQQGSIPSIDMKDAVQNCDYLNVILTNHDKRNQCLAIVPQYESYHIQKWMRMGLKGIDSTKDLKLVSRGMQSNGKNQFDPPTKLDRTANREILSRYFEAFPYAMKELEPLLEGIATPHKTVTVMVSNFGQSELLVNFVCSARSRQLDISSVLVFATDLETKALAESLGLAAYYDKRNFDSIPSEAAARYGDRKFTAMMMAKVMCVQMVSSLGYNILFQDVDIVWYKNPIPYFEEKNSALQKYDMLFQDDGGHSVRYAPYSANSGFYYVRHNKLTENFFSALLNSGDLILRTDSHQQALISLMSEHVSLYGLKVKVFSRDTDEFPGGYHYHMKNGNYMRKLFAGTVDPYIFHMSWTLNKDNKLLFLQQMGEWYVNKQCVHKKAKNIPTDLIVDASSKTPFADACCSAEPIVKCHYKDKPSKNPCYASPAIDKGKASFWKLPKDPE